MVFCSKCRLIYLGVEDEFFPGEIKEMILEAVAEKLKNTAPKSRRHDVLSDIIQKMGLKEQLKNEQIQ